MTTQQPSKPDAGPCRVLLIGMMGSGKSTVGSLVADRTGWAYHDNDDLLFEAEGMTARQILAARGDAGLLAAEVGALRRALEQPSPSVAGVAARVVLDPAAREAMRASGTVVWLRVTPETIRDRAAGSAHRPWPEHDAMEWIRSSVTARDPLYAAVADLTLDANAAPPPELADAILALLEDRGCLPSAEG